MELKGKVIQIMEPVSGTSKAGKDWSTQEFVIETAEQYPKKVAFKVWNEKSNIPRLGAPAEVHFNIDSNEHNGTWYTTLTVWKIIG